MFNWKFLQFGKKRYWGREWLDITVRNILEPKPITALVYGIYKWAYDDCSEKILQKNMPIVVSNFPFTLIVILVWVVLFKNQKLAVQFSAEAL